MPERQRRGFTSLRPEEVLVPGQGIVEVATERSGTFEADRSATLDGVRVPPGEFRRRWHDGEFAFAQVGRKRRRGAPAFKGAQGPIAKQRAPKGARTASPRPASAHEAFQEALRRGYRSLDDCVSLIWGQGRPKGALEHRPSCPTAYGSVRWPSQEDQIACVGCWSEHMYWTGRVRTLGRVVRAYEVYLEDSFNELLASEPAVWADTRFLLRARRPATAAGPDWSVVARLHGLLGVQPGRDVSRARELADLFATDGERNPEPGEPEDAWQRMREKGLAERGVEALLSAIERAVDRSEGEATALRRAIDDPEQNASDTSRVSTVLTRAIEKRLIEPAGFPS